MRVGITGLEKIDPDFPAFVLCGCIYEIDHYLKDDAPAFSRMKFGHFSHDAVVYHSREIRKRVRNFKHLADPVKRKAFMEDISKFFAASKTTLLAAGIQKATHKKAYAFPDDPYEIALLFCLERLYGCMKDSGDHANRVVCVFEERGEAEDAVLAKEFRRICAGANLWKVPLPFDAVFANKQQNMPGLQIADLAAYPIARHVIDSAAPNPAFDVLKPLFRKSPNGKIHGWGLKIFP